MNKIQESIAACRPLLEGVSYDSTFAWFAGLVSELSRAAVSANHLVEEMLCNDWQLTADQDSIFVTKADQRQAQDLVLTLLGDLHSSLSNIIVSAALLPTGTSEPLIDTAYEQAGRLDDPRRREGATAYMYPAVLSMDRRLLSETMSAMVIGLYHISDRISAEPESLSDLSGWLNQTIIDAARVQCVIEQVRKDVEAGPKPSQNKANWAGMLPYASGMGRLQLRHLLERTTQEDNHDRDNRG